MYKVMGKDVKEFDDLTLAMNYAKTLNEFVSIVGNGIELVGKFGVDSVENSKLPDGSKYDWTMRRGENKSWRRKKG